MATYGVAEAKARFSELAERAHHGETVVILRHGKPFACLTPAPADMQDNAARKVDVNMLRKALVKQRKGALSGVEAVRRIRDKQRF